MRICGCTPNGHECAPLGGCVCHGVASALGREPTSDEIVGAERAYAAKTGKPPEAWAAVDVGLPNKVSGDPAHWPGGVVCCEKCYNSHGDCVDHGNCECHKGGEAQEKT